MKPLQGLRVIDLTQAMAAPFCTMNLADMGADVIKIEPPGEGEPTRQLGAAQKNGHSATFMTMNRGKRSLAVDLKRARGRGDRAAPRGEGRRVRAELPAGGGRASGPGI